MWLLCVMLMHRLPLHSVCLVFLLVGHTHDHIDRFFSRLRVAIAGRDYYTVAELMKLIVDGLPGFNVRPLQTAQSFACSVANLNRFPCH